MTLIKFDKKFWGAVAILVGTIVGAGIFGLPYATAKVGFPLGIFYLLVLTLAVLVIHLSYAEVILRTKEKLQMAGYAEKYLGRLGKVLIAASLIFGIYASLVVYTIGIGIFLEALLSPLFGGSSFLYGLIFWVFGSLVVFLGLRLVSKLELLMVGLLILVTFFIFLFVLPQINFNHLSSLNFTSWRDLFFPYAIFLFALGGVSCLPLMREELKDKIHLFKKSVMIGTLMPTLVYFLFIIAVIGVSGLATSEEAIIGLSKSLGGEILLVGALFGVLAMATSFFSMGYVLRELFRLDYKIPFFFSWSLTVFVPLAIFIFALRNFLEAMSWAGNILMGFEGIILLAMFYQAKKKGDRQPEFVFKLPHWIAGIIILVFILGIIYQFIY